MKLRLLLPLAGLLLVAAIQPGAEDEKARAKELMKGFDGMWDSEMTYMGGPAMKGTEEVKLVSGGLVAMVKASSPAGPGQTFEGYGMIGYDAHDKVWRHIWCDNMDPGLSVTEGTWSADGKTFTVEEDADMGAGPQKMLMIVTLTGDGTREFKMLPKDAAADAAPMVTAKYKRRAP